MIQTKKLPSQETLKELLDYNPDTGIFTWKYRDEKYFQNGKYSSDRLAKTWNAKNAGKTAFTSVSVRGYLQARILGKAYIAHRVAWKWLYDEEPEAIDHQNHDRTDNREINLRAASYALNNKNRGLGTNNTSGYTGVHWCKQRNIWKAKLKINKHVIHLGSFKTIEEAVKARKQADVKYGFHENHGDRLEP